MISYNNFNLIAPKEPKVPLEAPKFVVELQPKQVNDGEEVLLMCQVTGSPLPEVHWYHNDTSIDRSEDFVITYDTETGKTELLIVECFPEDTGTYKCVARNPAGEAVTSAPLVVNMPQPLKPVAKQAPKPAPQQQAPAPQPKAQPAPEAPVEQVFIVHLIFSSFLKRNNSQYVCHYKEYLSMFLNLKLSSYTILKNLDNQVACYVLTWTFINRFLKLLYRRFQRLLFKRRSKNLSQKRYQSKRKKLNKCRRHL